jgi:hypothetical protein
MQRTLETSNERIALVRPGDISTALSTIYGGADGKGTSLQGWIPVFEVYDNRSGRRDVQWFDASKGLDPVIRHATERAIALAALRQGDNNLRHVAICGATFGDRLNENGKRAASIANIAQLHAFAVDHDLRPFTSVPKLREIVKPTFSVESGGYDGVVAKRHDWIVYKSPLIGQQEIEVHRSAASRLIKWCEAGDSSVASPVHPLRCPGVLHRKAKVRAAAIVEADGDVIAFQVLTEAIDRVAPAEAPKQRKTPREKEDNRIGWRENIRAGEEMHDSLNKLAMSLAHDGRTCDEIETELDALMQESIRQHTDHASWQERYNDISRIVETALGKVESSESFAVQEDRRAKVSLMRDPAQVAAMEVDVTARIEKLTPAEFGQTVLDDIIADTGLLRLDDVKQAAIAAKIAGKLKQKKNERLIVKKIKEATIRARGLLKASNAQPDTDPRTKIIRETMGFEARVGAAWDALKAAPEPLIWRGADGLVRLRSGPKGEPTIETLDAHSLGNEMRKVVRWHHEADGLDTAPHGDVISDMLAEGNPRLDVLLGFTDVPRFDGKGDVMREPGYYKNVGMIYRPPSGFELPPIPGSPTSDDITKARELILEAYEGFPFRDVGIDPDIHSDDTSGLEAWDRRALYGHSSRAHAIALSLLPFGRALIDGPTPLHLVTKTQNRAGGGYLGATFSRICFGREPQWQQEVKNDPDEWRKKISACVACGLQAFMLDNIDQSLASGVLASALTADEWIDRVLGTLSNVTGSIRWTWFAVGINPDVSPEIGKRILRIHIEPRVKDPEMRNDFRHPDLAKWTYENRPMLVWAHLVAWQKWVADGMSRDSSVRFGGFDDYGQVMHGVLAGLGISGFLGNRTQESMTLSRERSQRAALMAAVYRRFGDKAVSVGNPDEPLPALLTKDDDYKGGLLRLIHEEALEIDGIDVGGKFAEKKALQTKLGILLQKWDGNIETVTIKKNGKDREVDVRLERVEDKKKHRFLYRVTPLDSTLAGPAGPLDAPAGPLNPEVPPTESA